MSGRVVGRIESVVPAPYPYTPQQLMIAIVEQQHLLSRIRPEDLINAYITRCQRLGVDVGISA